MDRPGDSLPQDAHLQRLRNWRNRPERDTSLHFLADQFKREVAKPYKQLQSIVALWNELLPEPLAKDTRLESLSRGVLKVSVQSSATLYELDRLLRSGLEREIITRHKGPALRRIQLRVAPFEDEPNEAG